MSVLYAVAKLSRSNWRHVPFERRVEVIERHYDLSKRDDVHRYSVYFPKGDIGVFVAWKDYQNCHFRHFQTGNHGQRHVMTNFPFGYSTFGCSVDSIGSALSSALMMDHGAIRRINPPLSLITIDEGEHSVHLWNDALGLSKMLRWQVRDETVLSNRPMAAFILAGEKPRLSERGWAAEQLSGSQIGTLTPYENLERLQGGSRVSLTRHENIHTRELHQTSYFTEPSSTSAVDGFDQFARELRSFGSFDKIDVALSGGRDSRATAALFSSHETAVLRTNARPELEAVVARQLVERLPNFDRFSPDNNRAFDRDDRTIWVAQSPTDATTGLPQRAAEWTRFLEGFGVAGVLATDCGKEMFPTDRPTVTVAGDGGECAKAYYWSPNMVSGAYARSVSRFMEEIKNTPLATRVRTHPLTAPAANHFAKSDMASLVTSGVHQARQEANQNGIFGYRFFDYWWLTERYAVANVSGYASPTYLLPFMSPAYMATALQMTPHQRCQAKLLSDLAAHYQPAWSDVPFYDQLQGSADVILKRSYRQPVWEGSSREWFMDTVRNSDLLGHPYDVNKIRAFFLDVEMMDETDQRRWNPKAQGLIYRHMTGLLCREVAAAIEEMTKPRNLADFVMQARRRATTTIRSAFASLLLLVQIQSLDGGLYGLANFLPSLLDVVV